MSSQSLGFTSPQNWNLYESQSLGFTSPQNWNLYESSHDEDYDQNRPRVPVSYRHQQEGGEMYAPWRLFEERVRTGPYGLSRSSFPSQPYSPIRVLILNPGTRERVNPRLRQFIRDSPPRIRSGWHLGSTQNQREDPGLTESEFNKAMKKLRKEVYNPTYPRKKSWMRGLFSTKSSINITEGEEKNEDKSCTVCLEDFVPNEQVLVTPCNHMFHNDCIVPWVRSHGKCPVCRFVLCEKTERVSSYYYNNDGVVSGDDSAFDLVWLIRAMEEALNWINVSD